MVFTHPFCMCCCICFRHLVTFPFCNISLNNFIVQRKVTFLYNIRRAPVKRVVSCFWHLHFSEHEKLRCRQLTKAYNKSPHSGVATMKASCVAALSFFFHDTIIAHIPLDIYRQTRTFSAHLYFYWIFWNRIMGQCLVMPSAYCTLIGI